MLTSGTDWTGPKPDGPAIGSVWSVGSDDIGLVIPLLVAINPLDVDVHVDVVVALPNKNHLFINSKQFIANKLFVNIATLIIAEYLNNYLPLPDNVPFPVADEPFPFPTWIYK